ncbi:hypothetical protein [Bosea sp. WAO]|uniref:hypothetical protein n=1 Tax=Bosea sp. WAO TaxID=406341 RepID=UPI000ABF3BF0|nr:hypothetical protein [Bosea sp. WAO]
MTHPDEVLKNDPSAESLPEVETRLLKATHDLAATLGVDPVDALCALASVVERRADFERLRGIGKTQMTARSR